MSFVKRLGPGATEQHISRLRGNHSRLIAVLGQTCTEIMRIVETENDQAHLVKDTRMFVWPKQPAVKLQTTSGHNPSRGLERRRANHDHGLAKTDIKVVFDGLSDPPAWELAVTVINEDKLETPEDRGREVLAAIKRAAVL